MNSRKYTQTLIIALMQLLFVTLFSCGGREKTKTVKHAPKPDSSISIDKNYIIYNLPRSEYNYIIRITKVAVKQVNNAFEVSTDKYEVPTKIDGRIISITYEITNPYNKEMFAPIPDYYYITAPEFAQLRNPYHSRDCDCFIDNQADIYYNGVEMYNAYDKRIDGRYCLLFKPKESKVIQVVFREAKPANIRNVTFMGFDEKSGGTVHRSEVGVEIDLDSLEIGMLHRNKQLR